jgi:hypothetical protein
MWTGCQISDRTFNIQGASWVPNWNCWSCGRRGSTLASGANIYPGFIRRSLSHSSPLAPLLTARSFCGHSRSQTRSPKNCNFRWTGRSPRTTCYRSARVLWDPCPWSCSIDCYVSKLIFYNSVWAATCPLILTWMFLIFFLTRAWASG